jgi:hypothetical protein
MAQTRSKFKGIAAVPLFLIAGIGTGLATASQVIQGNFGSFAVNNGPWRTWPAAGSPSIDPYTRGHFLVHGRLPMSTFEAVEYIAAADSEGERLDPSCNYVIAGAMAPARWWRITARQSDSVQIAQGESVLSQMALIEPNNHIKVIASRDPQPGNWLKLPNQSYLEFTLTLFSPASSVKSANATVPLPKIIKEACS